MPARVQRTRRRGQLGMPPGAKYVGRGTRWGNPFRVGDPHPHPDEHGRPIRDRAEAVDLFELHIGPMGIHEYDDDTLAVLRDQLGGRDLACWCPLPQPGEPDHCHATVLLRLANTPAASRSAHGDGRGRSLLAPAAPG